jgi:ABC-type multidrug transport system fused ATPase/permease subunit
MVTQDLPLTQLISLRDRIGVVPQNPILFDDTIMNNVRYGRITATDEEVFEACQAACIHDKIKGFTHGMRTSLSYLSDIANLQQDTRHVSESAACE